ncbi:MAG: manganese efflux pump [Desulfovibrionales bacterium]|nr:manganese efflux pump [Desulfovibrionales bacterium]
MVSVKINDEVVTLRQTFRLSWHFGLFQALMPVLGWFGGFVVRDYFLRFGHWIAFALLLYIGGHMLWEGLKGGDDDACQDPTVGFTLAMLGISVWVPAAIIGLVALLFTATGLHLGKIVGCRTKLGQQAEVLGGLALLAIGVKILWQAL